MNNLDFNIRKSLCKKYKFVFSNQKILGRLDGNKFIHRDNFCENIKLSGEKLVKFLHRKGIYAIKQW